MIAEKYTRPGQTVYIINPYQGVLQGEIDSFTNNQGTEWVKILLQYGIYRDGTKNKNIVIGSTYAKVKDCFLTLEEAYAEIDRRERKQIKNYLDKMKTLEDLIRFPLEHGFCGNEYMEEKKAYIIKAKEFGFLMNEDKDLEDEDASLRRER